MQGEIIQKSSSHLKILGDLKVTWSNFQNRDPQILRTITQKLIHRVTGARDFCISGIRMRVMITDEAVGNRKYWGTNDNTPCCQSTTNFLRTALGMNPWIHVEKQAISNRTIYGTVIDEGETKRCKATIFFPPITILPSLSIISLTNFWF